VAPIGLLPPAGSTRDKINRSVIKVNADALKIPPCLWIIAVIGVIITAVVYF
jgi:hypothetical protein